MPWVKIDDDVHSHPEVLKIGDAAFGLYVRLEAWSAMYGTDGLVPKAQAALLAGGRLDRGPFSRLLDQGWCQPAANSEDQIQLVHFLNRNPSKAELEAAAANAAARKARWRGRSETRSEQRPNPNPNPNPNPEDPPTPRTRGRLTLQEEHAVTRTVETLNATTGRNFDPFAEGTRKEIIRAIRKDGATLPQLQQVVAYLWAEWGDDPKMAKHVDPTTPFRAANFKRYLALAQAGRPKLRNPEAQGTTVPSFGLPGASGYASPRDE